jgi:molybdopterin/thiamine biosynthesis adenylyltransferase
LGKLDGKRILVIGIGGIGTYFCISALIDGARINAYDGDVVEETNLDRQFLYYGKVGMKKAAALKERLRNFKHIEAKAEYITKSNLNRIQGFDAIACCVDNWKARILASRIALESGKPITNGSVTALSSSIDSYLSGICECMTCNKGLVKLAKTPSKPRQGCAFEREPNIVLTNALAGSIMCGELLNISANNPARRLNYYSYSDYKLKNSPIEDCCNKKECICKCHRGEK